MIIHVLGQIGYKLNSLPIVAEELKTWSNQNLIEDAVKELYRVIQTHEKFNMMVIMDVRNYLNEMFNMNLE